MPLAVALAALVLLVVPAVRLASRRTASHITGGSTAAWPTCTNQHLGFAIAYPPGWHVFDGYGPDRACAFFDPRPFDPSADPEDAALMVTAEGVPFEDASKLDPVWRTSLWEPVTIAGRKAFRREAEVVGEAAYDRGTREYGYEVDRDGSVFAVSTIGLPESQAYARNRGIVDAAAHSLRFVRLTT